jgi:hypothetical protein
MRFYGGGLVSNDSEAKENQFQFPCSAFLRYYGMKLCMNIKSLENHEIKQLSLYFSTSKIYLRDTSELIW